MKAGVLWFIPFLLAAQNGITIEGTASNRVTGQGIPGVTVKLAAASAPLTVLHHAKSDGAGAFRIDGVAGGDYCASFEVPHGFIVPSQPDPLCKPFRVAEGGGSVKLQIPITPLPTLHVRVVDSDDRPVPRVRVEVFVATGGGGAFGNTDLEGRFSEALLPGAYKLRARPVLPGTPLAQRSKELSPISAKPPEGERWIWAPTYFPSATEIAGAESIVVREGAELPEYEIRLRAVPVYRLRGHVSDDEGEPARGVALQLLSEIGWGTAEAQAVSGRDGAFEFPSVRAGEWQIAAESKRGAITSKGVTRYTMPQHDVDDVTLQISPPFTLDAIVEGVPRNEMGKAGLYVGLVPTIDHYEMQSHAQQQPDGTLHFESVYPGRYRFAQWGFVPGYYLQSILLGMQDVTGRDVDLTPQSPSPRLIYKANAARAQGKVENGAGAKVVFVQAAQDGYIPGQDVRVAVCDQEGRFTLEALRPTEYYAFAFAIAGVNTGAVREAVFALGLSREAQTVRLEEGETARLELKITPFPVTLQRP